jgi:hypothetical protein
VAPRCCGGPVQQLQSARRVRWLRRRRTAAAGHVAAAAEVRSARASAAEQHPDFRPTLSLTSRLLARTLHTLGTLVRHQRAFIRGFVIVNFNVCKNLTVLFYIPILLYYNLSRNFILLLNINCTNLFHS